MNTSHVLSDDVKAYASLAPIAGTGSYQNGGWVERTNYGSALVVIPWTTSGGVTGGAIKFRVEDATDSSGTASAVFLAEQSVTIPAGPNATGVAQYALDLRGARSHIRIGVDSDPTGGSPASIVSAVAVLGRATRAPAP